MLEYLTVEDVASRLTVSTETVRRWLRAKELRGIPLGRAGYRITEDDFEAFVQQRNARTMPEPERTPDPVFLSPILQQRLIDNSTDCIKVLDPQGKLLYMNSGGLRELEIDDFAQCQNVPWPMLWREIERYKVEDAVAIASTGGVGTFEGSTPTAKGTPKWWSVTVTPILNTRGSVQYLLAISKDITQRKEAEIALLLLTQTAQVNKQRLELAQQAAHIGTFEWNIPTNTVIWTPELEALYGLAPGGFEGKYENWALRVHPDDLKHTEQSLDEAIHGGLPYNAEFRVLWPDDSIHWILGRGQLYNDEQGKPFRMIGINMDIGERKELEQRKDEFIGMASHELRTPITTIKANLQLAERHIRKLLAANTTSAEIRRGFTDLSTMVERGLRQVDVQSRLINDLMDASRIQADKLALSPQTRDLVTIIREVWEEQCQVTPRRTITLEVQTQEPLLVFVDSERIAQVVSNYLTNAIKYSPEAEPITIGLNVEGPNVCVWVRDHGIGLSEEVQQHIWDRFYQVQGRERGSRVAGLGLGLYICQTLVQRHGGTVGVDSKVGEGSRFWFTLPLVTNEDH